MSNRSNFEFHQSTLGQNKDDLSYSYNTNIKNLEKNLSEKSNDSNNNKGLKKKTISIFKRKGKGKKKAGVRLYNVGDKLPITYVKWKESDTILNYIFRDYPELSKSMIEACQSNYAVAFVCFFLLYSLSVTILTSAEVVTSFTPTHRILMNIDGALTLIVFIFLALLPSNAKLYMQVLKSQYDAWFTIFVSIVFFITTSLMKEFDFGYIFPDFVSCIIVPTIFVFMDCFHVHISHRYKVIIATATTLMYTLGYFFSFFFPEATFIRNDFVLYENVYNATDSPEIKVIEFTMFDLYDQAYFTVVLLMWRYFLTVTSQRKYQYGFCGKVRQNYISSEDEIQTIRIMGVLHFRLIEDVNRSLSTYASSYAGSTRTVDTNFDDYESNDYESKKIDDDFFDKNNNQQIEIQVDNGKSSQIINNNNDINNIPTPKSFSRQLSNL